MYHLSLGLTSTSWGIHLQTLLWIYTYLIIAPYPKFFHSAQLLTQLYNGLCVQPTSPHVEQDREEEHYGGRGTQIK